MIAQPDIICIGSVLWDVIGRSKEQMRFGSDVPGQIERLPGGVAMNIAMTLRYFDLSPALLTAIGRDADGDMLILEAQRMGLITDYIYRSSELPTDVYMAIECETGLVAAIAHAHSLEAAGAQILEPLFDGRLGHDAGYWTGPIALDGNLTVDLLRSIATHKLFLGADLRVAPASPGKVDRLHALVSHPSATFYVNLEESGLLCGRAFETSEDAAKALIALGMARVLVTNGAGSASFASGMTVITQTPPKVLATRVTGAGDTLMAAHIAAERAGDSAADALAFCLTAAANYVSGKPPK